MAGTRCESHEADLERFHALQEATEADRRQDEADGGDVFCAHGIPMSEDCDEC